MSLLQRLGYGQSRRQAEVRAEQVSALKAALNKCRDVAMRGKRMQRGVTVIVGVLMLVLCFVLGSYEKALEIVRPLADNGDARAQSLLARMYYRGRAVRQDHVEALKWFRRAAEQGDATAQFNLGVMYSEGDSVPQDKTEAQRWY